ncbi:asparagine synthase-related protein [Bacillus sp. 1P02SD]|uniref:asparagine synthase-related protein n=1 Tax=Bacillus sp. 1P02SD TaxID=3132264 RepID=UPI0039A310D7
MDYLRLNSFLKLGYFLDYINHNYECNLSGINKHKYSGINEEELVEIGTNITKKAITDLFAKNSNNVVPISGGFDSRAILAGLVECTDAKNIDTYTFGTPGTLDYEIGNFIAKKFGTNHYEIPLGEHVFTMDELIETSFRTDHQTVLFFTAPLTKMKAKYSNHINWSGAFAGPPTGNVLLKNPSLTVEEAKTKFINHKYSHVKSLKLTNCEDEELHKLLAMDFINSEILTYDEQLHINFAQGKWIGPHLLMEGFNYQTPFMNQEWLNFMLSIENKYRIDQYLYKKILLRAYPIAFSYKTKSNYGCSLSTPQSIVYIKRAVDKFKRSINKRRKYYTDPYTNYIDFNAGIRERKDLKKIIYENVMDLTNRKLVEWIDIESIWKNHINKNGNFADALLVLASLEIHLKAIESKRGE